VLIQLDMRDGNFSYRFSSGKLGQTWSTTVERDLVKKTVRYCTTELTYYVQINFCYPRNVQLTGLLSS